MRGRERRKRRVRKREEREELERERGRERERREERERESVCVCVFVNLRVRRRSNKANVERFLSLNVATEVSNFTTTIARDILYLFWPESSNSGNTNTPLINRVYLRKVVYLLSNAIYNMKIFEKCSALLKRGYIASRVSFKIANLKKSYLYI